MHIFLVLRAGRFVLPPLGQEQFCEQSSAALGRWIRVVGCAFLCEALTDKPKSQGHKGKMIKESTEVVIK